MIEPMNEMWPEERKQLAPEDQHQGADLNFRALLLVGAGLVLLIALAIAGGNLLTPEAADVRATRRPLDPERIEEPPDPRITQSHRLQRRQLERRVAERLSSYGWVDRDAGVARIPIQRAVELVLERGLPARMEPDGARVNVPPAGAGPASGREANPVEEGPSDGR